MSHQTCSIDIFVYLQPFGCHLKVRLYDPIWGKGIRVGRGDIRSISCPWVLISFPLTHMVYLLQFLSYLAFSKSVSDRIR